METVKKPRGTMTAAFVLNIVTMVTLGLCGLVFMASAIAAGSFYITESIVQTTCWLCFAICLLPYLWVVPMTIKLNRQRKARKNPGILFSILTLLLVNVISGILMLCTRGD